MDCLGDEALLAFAATLTGPSAAPVVHREIVNDLAGHVGK